MSEPEVPPVESIPLGLGFDAYGFSRGDVLLRISELEAQVISWEETALTIVFSYVVAMFVAARVLSRLQFTLATTLYLAALAGCYMKGQSAIFTIMMYNSVLFGDAPPLNAAWWNENVPSWFFAAEFYLQSAVQLASVLLSIYLAWRFRRNPPEDLMKLPAAMEQVGQAHSGAGRANGG